jgi:hypothetical protein
MAYFKVLLRYLILGCGKTMKGPVRIAGFSAEIQARYLLNTPSHLILGNELLCLIMISTYSRLSDTMIPRTYIDTQYYILFTSYR